jgi:hypothetical protein
MLLLHKLNALCGDNFIETERILSEKQRLKTKPVRGSEGDKK